MNRRASKALIWLVALLAIWAGLLQLVPMLVDKQALKTSIEEGIQKSTGLQFTIQELAIHPTLFQGLQVDLNTSRITDTDKNPLGDVRHITIQIRYFPLLLRRTPEIAKVHLNHVSIPVGKNNLFQAIHFKYVKPEPTGFIQPAEMKNTEILLTNALVEDVEVPIFTRRLYRQAQKFRLEGSTLSIKHLRGHQPVVISAKGNMAFTGKSNSNIRIPIGQYHLEVRLPQAVTQEGHVLQASDLSHLRFSLSGQDVPLSLRYQKQGAQSASGQLTSRAMNLGKLQALLFQLSDTFALAIPEDLKKYYMIGAAELDGRFQLVFKKPRPQVQWNGTAILHNVAFATMPSWPQAAVSRLNGKIGFAQDKITVYPMAFQLAGLPLRVRGQYSMNQDRMDFWLTGQNLTLGSLRGVLKLMGLPPSLLAGIDLSGWADASIHAKGSPENPRYLGTIVLKKGAYKDLSRGLAVHNVSGRFQFNGSGLKAPKVTYQGALEIAQGQYTSPTLPFVVERFLGTLKIQGAYLAGEVFKLPDYRGFIRVQEAHYEQPDNGIRVQHIRGTLNLADQIEIKDFQALVGQELFKAQGTISKNFKDYQVRVLANNIHLQRFKTDVLSRLPAAQGILTQLQPYSGTAQVNLLVSTGPAVSGRVNLHGVALQTAMENMPVRIPTLTLLLNRNRVELSPTQIYYGSVALRLGGFFQKGSRYQFNVSAPDVPMSLIRDQGELLTLFTGSPIPEIWNTAGSVGIHGRLANDGSNLSLDFHQAGLSWQNGDFPLYDLNGRLSYQKAPGKDPVVSTRNLAFRYGNSPVTVQSGQVARGVQLVSHGVLSPLLVNHFLADPRSISIPYGPVPFRIALNGILGSLLGDQSTAPNLNAQVYLDLNPTLRAGNQPSETPTNPVNSLPVASLPPHGTPSRKENLPEDVPEPDPSLQPDLHSAYFNANLHLDQKLLTLSDTVLNLFDSGRLLMQGSLQNPLNPLEPGREFSLKMLTEDPIQLGRLAHVANSDLFDDAQGTFATDITMAGAIGEGMHAQGWLQAQDVALPYLTLRNLTGRVELPGDDTATFNFERLEMPGVSASVRAKAEDLTQYPVTLSDVSITGPSLAVTSLIDFQNDILQPIFVNQIMRNFLPPLKPGDPILGFQFREGQLAFDELIYENIILDKFKGLFSVYANTFFEIRNVELEAAGGRATGYLSMNPADRNFLTVELNVHDVSANALTRALLNVTNQIFGDVNGIIRFTTSGETPDIMLKNANGTASFTVTDGRLPAIARVETLLSAANILRGGILGLNLNNLFRTLSIYDTNYFATLSGDFLVAEGALHTDNLVSDGENLDLSIQGKLSMEHGEADMLINGLMSQDVSGKLGPLGKLSLGSIIRYIPGLGSFGAGRTGLLGHIPGLGYVPGFGGPAQRYNRFQVRIIGPLDDPGAIKDFHWVSPAQLL